MALATIQVWPAILLFPGRGSLAEGVALEWPDEFADEDEHTDAEDAAPEALVGGGDAVEGEADFGGLVEGVATEDGTSGLARRGEDAQIVPAV